MSANARSKAESATTETQANADPEARIAVVVPFYNDADLIGEAVDSIREREPLEIVVVDDASPDPESREALDRLPEGVRVLRHEHNQGVGAARMTGVGTTSAPYVFPLDSDDQAVAGALGKMADRLDADPAVGVCFGDYAEFGDSESVCAVPERLDAYRIAYTDEYPISILIRRDALEQCGGWTSADVYEDWDLWMSIVEHGVSAVHLGRNEITYRRRVHVDRRGADQYARHREVYRRLRARHPALFSSLRDARRNSDLSPMRKLLFPLVYGGRRRLPGETWLRTALADRGVWTLRR
jgi:glycosyltransferase involved in cell wall biosynthesis